jgi:hypothetical protein
MKYYRLILLCIALSTCFSAQAEIGEADVIDAIATKPERKNVILMLYQARPWNDESIKLFDKKVQFYAFALSSNALVEQDPSLKGKSFRIVAIYNSVPPASITKHFEELRSSFAKAKVDFVWGVQDDLLMLSNKP